MKNNNNHNFNIHLLLSTRKRARLEGDLIALTSKSQFELSDIQLKDLELRQ